MRREEKLGWREKKIERFQQFQVLRSPCSLSIYHSPTHLSIHPPQHPYHTFLYWNILRYNGHSCLVSSCKTDIRTTTVLMFTGPPGKQDDPLVKWPIPNLYLLVVCEEINLFPNLALRVWTILISCLDKFARGKKIKTDKRHDEQTIYFHDNNLQH